MSSVKGEESGFLFFLLLTVSSLCFSFFGGRGLETFFWRRND
jgi:hypothetical protein